VLRERSLKDRDQLSATAIALGAVGEGFRKGVLAADESTGTISKRFQAIGAQIGGVILFDETLRQSAADGTSFVEIIEAAGGLPGIMVDRGITPLPGFPGESITQGLDGLAARLAEYRKPGARFAKWRAVIDVGPGVPSDHAIAANTGWKPAVQVGASMDRGLPARKTAQAVVLLFNNPRAAGWSRAPARLCPRGAR
jgi:fructose-bisphosphate aldolase class 1